MERLSFDEMKCFQHSELIAPAIESIQAGKSVVVDSVYTRAAWRRGILEATEQIPCKRILIYINTPLEECIRRNRGRENPLPDFVVESIYNSIQPPEKSEGWDEIKEVKTYESDFTGN